jgi:hypothetical protein
MVSCAFLGDGGPIVYIFIRISKCLNELRINEENQKSKIKNQKSKIKNQKSKIKNQKSKIKNQK